ncbi:hypothetical protein KIL84_022637, partial [Mauremys mutica]
LLHLPRITHKPSPFSRSAIPPPWPAAVLCVWVVLPDVSCAACALDCQLLGAGTCTICNGPGARSCSLNPAECSSLISAGESRAAHCS